MAAIKPNTTQTPNVIFDEYLPLMKEAELRVTLAIIRKTFGWHKDEDELSLTMLMKLTGMGRQGVLNGIEAGMERGLIQRREQGQGFLYSLAVDEVDQSTKETGTSPLSRPEVVHEVDTQKKERNLKKDSAANAAGVAGKERKPRPRNPVFDAVATHIFGIDAASINGFGGRVAKIANWVAEAQLDCSPLDLVKFKSWYQASYPRLSLPRDLGKFQERWVEFITRPDGGGEKPLTQLEKRQMAELGLLDD